MSTTDYTKECEGLPATVTDSNLHAMLLQAWFALYAIYNGKAAYAMRSLGDWIADDLELNELSLDRVAVKKLISTWASKLRGKQRRALELMPKRAGMVTNPYAEHPKHPGRLVHEVVLEQLWKACKSEVSNKLNRAANVEAPTGRKDTHGVPLDPCALDLSGVTFKDEYNARVDNVFTAFIPSSSDPVETSTEDINAVWAL